MDLALSPDLIDIRERARRFADEVLVPLELVTDENDGLPPADYERVKGLILEHRFNAINMPTELGGQGYTLLQQVIQQEQLGRTTGCLWDVAWRPALPLIECTPWQRETYLEPECRLERRHAYAITEEGAGSDPSRLATTAERIPGGFRITGTKWFVTVGDVADYMIVVAEVAGEGQTSFLVDKALPGVREVRRPRYTHAFAFEHPEFAFDGVEVSDRHVLGGIGAGSELTRRWFTDERVMIAARCLGGAQRGLEEALAYATGREQFGQSIFDFQGVSFPLADCAVELAAARALTYQVAWEGTRGLDPKTLHAKASSAKLFASEVAGRVLDRCVQVLGGRGYMREQAVERLNRDLRVDRIWEGTSEIQRLVVANELRKRGPRAVTAWPE